LDFQHLQVCCYLSRIKTELYFRQVLGRIVRAKDEPCSYAYLYTLAEEDLLEYAKRIGDDLPDHLATVELQQITEETTLQEDILDNPKHELGDTATTQQPSNDTKELATKPLISFTDKEWEESLSTPIPSSDISLFGQFSEELITLQHAFNKAR